MYITWFLGPVIGMLTLSTVAGACQPGTLIARFRVHTRDLYSKLVTDNKQGDGWWIHVRAKNPTTRRAFFYTGLINCNISGYLEPGAVKTRRCFFPEYLETFRTIITQGSAEGNHILYSGRICQAHPDVHRNVETLEDLEDGEETTR